jgi:ADP-ribose pyrophosphatase
VRHKKGGGACTVPVLPDGRILMIRKYRPAIDREALELPAGARDASGEDPAVTAARELEEETGYRPGKMTRLASILTAIAWCNERTDIYLAQDLEKAGEQQLDEAEEIEICAIPLKELCERIFAGEIQDAKTVAGIMAYRSFLAEKAAEEGPEKAKTAETAEEEKAVKPAEKTKSEKAKTAKPAEKTKAAKPAEKKKSAEAAEKTPELPDTLLTRLRRVLKRARTG